MKMSKGHLQLSLHYGRRGKHLFTYRRLSDMTSRSSIPCQEEAMCLLLAMYSPRLRTFAILSLSKEKTSHT